MRFSIVNLGCKVNRVESDAVAAQLLERGAEACEPAAADLIVVNTCTVTGEAEKKTRKAVRQALRANNTARVIVTGCAAALKPEAFEEMSPRVVCVPKAQLGAAVSREADALEPRAPLPHDGRPDLLRIGGEFPTRVGVKVQDGCNNACTYCIVHVARGRATSRDIDEVAGECAAYARAGVKEIVLTGINLGSYRQRRADGTSLRLSDLLKRLLDDTAALHADGAPACRFRISSIEPRDVDEDLIDMLGSSDGRVCRHLHLPLQAGSSKVLREMARPYDAAFFVDLVARLRAAAPSISLSTDIIAGFPGETEAEFEETLSVARACLFSKIHAFPYSIRRGTPAAERSDQIPPEVKDERAARLRVLGDELRSLEFSRRVGTREAVLVEQDGRGMTESYFEVPVPTGLPAGSLVELTLSEVMS